MRNNTDTVTPDSGTPDPGTPDPVIELTDLCKVYVMGENEVHALRNVLLTIHKGEYVAIIGASGSGKSTLMNMIGLLDRPTSGSYRISGVEASQASKDRFQIKGAAQTDLWAVNTDGSGLHALTKPKTTLVDALPSNVAAAYSPDGQHIVFLSNRTDSGEAGDWHLWVMNADGSDQRQLPLDVAIDYTYGDDQVVSWGA